MMARPSSNIATRNISVTAVNDAPVITGQAPLTMLVDTSLGIVFANLTVTDPDNTYPTGFTLTVLDGTNYTHVGNTITPTTGYIGALTVPVKVNDGVADSNTYNLNVSVTPLATQLLTVTPAGTGAGTITSSPAGINCGAACSASFTTSSVVRLTAVANPTSTFSGWSGGGCSGTSPCDVTMDAAKSVTATFTLNVHSIPLYVGWNLVSFNLHPQNTDIATVLTSITGNFDLVYAWNAASGDLAQV